MVRHSVAIWSVLGILTLAVTLHPRSLRAQQESNPESSSDSETESSESEAEPERDFEALVSAGRKAYAEKRWEAAAEAFKKAYAVKQVPNLLYNIGRVYENAGQFENAVEYYEKFVSQPGIEIENRKDALDRINTLEQVVKMREKGKEVDKEKVEKKQSDRGLAEPKGTVTRKNYTFATVFLSAGAASLLGGSVFGLLTANAHSDFESAGSLAARRDAANRGQTFGIVADSLLVAGTVAGLVGGGFLIWPPKREVPASGRARVAPMFTPTSAGLTVDVDF